MRTLVLQLALGLLVGCGGPPSEVTTEASTGDSPPTTSSSTSTPDDTTGSATSASTGEEVCPPVPPQEGDYDPCPGLCGGGGQCFSDGVEYAVCTRGCFMACNCWPAPEGDGEAAPSCNPELLEDTRLCVLDCSGGESCPRGMFCVAELGICAHPYPGSGSSDTGSTGSSSSDSGTTVIDMSTTDMSTTGMSTTDTGTTDTGTTDTGTTGTGTTSGSTSVGTAGT